MRDAVAGARVEDQFLALAAVVLFGVDLGVEGAVGEVVDANLVDGAAELGDHLHEQVVCERSVERLAFDGQSHRLGLITTDENRQEFVPRTQDDDRRARAFVADADTDALDGGLVHTLSTLGGYEKISRPGGAAGTDPASLSSASCANTFYTVPTLSQTTILGAPTVIPITVREIMSAPAVTVPAECSAERVARQHPRSRGPNASPTTAGDSRRSAARTTVTLPSPATPRS